MRYLKRRQIQPIEYDASHQKERWIASHRTKRCGTCTYQVPESDITIEDGQERCPMCRDTYTAEWYAAEEQHVASVKTESAERLVIPPQYSIRPLTESRPGAVTLILDGSGNVLSEANPLRMLRNVATAVVLQGQYFTSACSMTYPTGLSDNVAPVITAAVPGGTPALFTLSIIAALGMTPGNYGFTFNDGVSSLGHTYPPILAIR